MTGVWQYRQIGLDAEWRLSPFVAFGPHAVAERHARFDADIERRLGDPLEPIVMEVRYIGDELAGVWARGQVIRFRVTGQVSTDLVVVRVGSTTGESWPC